MARNKRTGSDSKSSTVEQRKASPSSRRPRASVEIDADIHARYKELLGDRKLVDVTSTLVELFIDDPATQKKVLRRLGERALRRPQV